MPKKNIFYSILQKVGDKNYYLSIGWSRIFFGTVPLVMADHRLTRQMPPRYCKTFFYNCVAVMI